MSSKLRLVLPVVLLGLALVGCSDKEPGNATPGDASTTNTKTAPASTSNDGGGIGEVEPCSLLKAGDVSRLKLTAPKTIDKNRCEWRAEDRTLIAVSTHPGKGIKDFVPGANSEISEVKVGSRPAKFVKRPLTSSSCAYVLQVTEKSRVDVFATGPGLEGSCAAAKSVAEAIEPNLP